LTIFTTIWPGVTDLTTSAPTARAHLVHEGTHDVERDIGFEKGAADLAQREVHVLFRQRAAPR
jgi:hypothetical protein